MSLTLVPDANTHTIAHFRRTQSLSTCRHSPPFDPTNAGQNKVPDANPGVFIGQLPESGLERHLRDVSEDARAAMVTILDIESADTNKPDLPSMETIDAEESEEHRLKAERRESEKQKEEAHRAARVAVRDEFGGSSATGRRKTSVARVTLRPGEGAITINNNSFDRHIPDINHRGLMLRPFLVTNTMGLFDLKATVHGGGISGQAQAIRHGIARALELYEPAFRPALKKDGMLTRDPRKVERKKPGRKKARKAFQWVKR